MAEKEVRKTTAKKAVRRTTTKVAPRKTPVRKTASAVSSTRKAPTRVAAPVPRKRSKAPLVFFLLLTIVIGASLAIGYTDKGPIDVTSVIATRKQNATPEEQDRLKTVPVQQGQTNVVNGGLVGTGKPSPLVPSEPVATSSPETATSTETSTEEIQEEPQEEVSEETSTEPLPPQTEEPVAQ